MSKGLSNGAMLNAYPDSIGCNLNDLVKVLSKPEFKDVFSLFYALPTFFNSDLDRGFSIIDYDINKELVSTSDIDTLSELNIALKFDIVLNHLSVASPQFKDLLANGKESKYKNFFINWNEFWADEGDMNEDGVIVPHKKHLDKLFMRKPGLPILKVPFADGTEVPYWNTFYQKITVSDEDSTRTYLGQMDVNGKSPLVWEFYEEVLAKLGSYGCQILRLDAFAYLHKEIGQTNFFNEPGTWDYLERINMIAQKNNLQLLPEIHAEYGLHLHDEVAKKGYVIYDFFLPGLLIHAIEKQTSTAVVDWAQEIVAKNFKTVNMLGCHDGIPILDLKGKEVNGVYTDGLLSDEEIEEMMNLILERGGRVKNLYGADGNKISYYQVNATYYSALGESDQKMLLARAIQLFMPGTPQVWYLDVFAGKNDNAAADAAGEGGHKEINRTTLSLEAIEEGLKKEVVTKQLDMIRMRNTSAAFAGTPSFESDAEKLTISWRSDSDIATLDANLKTRKFTIRFSENGSEVEWKF